MSYIATNDSMFLSTVEHWLQETGEISALIRYSRAAGNKDFEFFSSMLEFVERLERMAPQTCVTVFREKQLPLRGRVDANFISTALRTVSNDEEYLIAGLEPVQRGAASCLQFLAGTSLEEFQEDLSSCEGQMVAVRIYPPWLEDNDDVISAVIPEATGTVTTGIY